LSEASSADPDDDRGDEPKSPITAAALLGSFFSLLRRMNNDLSTPLLETTVSSVSPLYSALQNTGEKCKIYLSTLKGEYPLTPSPISCGIVGYSHIPSCRGTK
jgi:hypothetical protein